MKYYIIAGEASGDLHGANLMKALMKQDPQAEIRFWGGDRMAAVGGTPVRHIRDLAYMGFVEVTAHLRTIEANIRFCKQDILQNNPDVCVFIDYPGFNLGIAKFTHQQGFKNVYYISPQVWAWKKGRLKAMRRDLDALCYILPSERDFFAHASMPQAQYVGHPLLDEVERYRLEASNTSHTDSSDTRPVVALLPGSRKQELQRMLPPMLLLASHHPEYQFQIAGMQLLGESFYRQVMDRCGLHPDNVEVLLDQTYPILSRSFAAVVCSGTATLETAIFRVPQMVCYKANAVSVAIARRLVKIKYISLVNIISDAPVVKELIQSDFSIDTLESEFNNITIDNDYRQQMLLGYDKVIDLLGNRGASERTAQIVAQTALTKKNISKK
ncbi:MAG: lipid-A-disaccharide synthase [Bacteroidales bacterium]|nr:lipid-A-disaccharide synthase [Bacteroidales bacterium]